MKALIQRVSSAQVVVDGAIVGQINAGLLCYIGIGIHDDLTIGKKLIDKILAYRIFAGEGARKDKLDRCVTDVGGDVLLVSQFTLMANTQKGLRPDFGGAMTFADAQTLFAQVVAYAQASGLYIATGQFGAHMHVSATNDGPLNFILEVS